VLTPFVVMSAPWFTAASPAAPPGTVVQRRLKVTYLDATGKEKWLEQSCRLCARVAGAVFVFDVNNRATLRDVAVWMQHLDSAAGRGNAISIKHQDMHFLFFMLSATLCEHGCAA